MPNVLNPAEQVQTQDRDARAFMERVYRVSLEAPAVPDEPIPVTWLIEGWEKFQIPGYLVPKDWMEKAAERVKTKLAIMSAVSGVPGLLALLFLGKWRLLGMVAVVIVALMVLVSYGENVADTIANLRARRRVEWLRRRGGVKQRTEP